MIWYQGSEESSIIRKSPLFRWYWNMHRKTQLSCVFFCNVGSYHFVGAYAGATACLRGHSGSLRGQKLKEICLRGLRACGFVQEVPTRLQSRRFFGPFAFEQCPQD